MVHPQLPLFPSISTFYISCAMRTHDNTPALAMITQYVATRREGWTNWTDRPQRSTCLYNTQRTQDAELFFHFHTSRGQQYGMRGVYWSRHPLFSNHHTSNAARGGIGPHPLCFFALFFRKGGIGKREFVA